jgi:2,3-dihydroxy-p-cumate/2,3-dihydroxybenzoate 3,4-dioxygenase
MAVSDIRYKRLGYVALNVTDLQRTLDFYKDIVGIDGEMSAGGDCVFLRCSDRHHDIVLFKGTPGVKRIGWQMESTKAWEAARAHFSEIGLAPKPVSNQETDLMKVSDAFRISEPTTGTVFEFYVNMDAAEKPFTPRHTKIMRLGHIVLNSPDRPAMEKFLVDHMNFRVSDRVEKFVSFMRCFPNPLHHSFGVGANEKAGLNHVNFMVTDIDDIGRAHNRVKANNVPIVYGPGRHPPSDSIFLYFLDPDGITVEYSFGMEEFDEVGPRPPRELPPSLESVDYWGGIPDPRFGKVGVIESSSQA